MTISIQMLQKIADGAQALATSMQAVVDDCAEQLAKRKAAGESEDDVMNEAFAKLPDAPTEGQPEQPSEAAPATAPTAPATATDEKSVSLAQLRAYVSERSAPEKRPAIKAILTKFGVKKLTELPESQYAALMREVANI